jgi:MFS family permease
MTAAAATVDSRAAWVVATAALVILSIAYGAPLLAAVALKPIAAEFGTARAAVAAAPSFAFVGAAFGGIAAGWLTGWLGIRRVVLFGAVMLAAGLILSASGGLFQLYAGHGVLMGLFGTSCMFSPIMTYVSRWFDRSRGAAVALISSGQSLAGAFWPIVFQAGISEFGWRRTMLVFGLFVGATILALAAIFLRPPPQPLPSKGRGGQDPKAGAPVLGLSPNLAMIILSVAIFCCCVPMAMPSQHIVAFCGDLGFGSHRRPADAAVEFDRAGDGVERLSAHQGRSRLVRGLRGFRFGFLRPVAGLCDRCARILSGEGSELASADDLLCRFPRHGRRWLGRRRPLRSLRLLPARFCRRHRFQHREPGHPADSGLSPAR